MEERLPREDILQLLKVEHQRLIDTLAQLTPEQMTQSGVVGIWSVKDVTAHLVYWNEFVTQELLAAVSGNTFQHPEGTGDEINARAVALYRDWTADEVCSALEQSYRELINCVEDLPASAFEAGSPIEQTLDETVHGALANNTYEHWPIHEAQIRAWIAL